MATENPYPSNAFEVPDKRRGGNTTKRKRESLDNLGAIGRAAPNTRRASAHSSGQPQSATALTNPHLAMADLGTTAFTNTSSVGNDDGTQQFDFSLQQSGADLGMGSGTPGQDVGNVDTATAALNQHYNMQVPRDDSFGGPPGAEVDDPNFGLDDGNNFQGLDGDGADGLGSRKPPVGSEEWNKVRRDNHKEVERRRRETINEGINELAKIIPNCEKNKGAVLQRAVQHIAKLQDEAAQNIDKWTFEKLITEQAINDLSGKLARAWAEKEAWRRIASEAGVDVDSIELGIGIADPGNTIVADDISDEACHVGNAAVQAAAEAIENQATTAQMQGSGIVDDVIDTHLDVK